MPGWGPLMERDASSAAGADRVRCSCGATFPRSENVTTHRYIRSAPECWAAFGEVLAREYEHPVLFGAVHQLTVDAYAAQHPENQPAKSLVSHLVSLYSILERGGAGPAAIKAFVEGRREFPTLVTPTDLGPLTIADVAAAEEPDTHRDTVRHWARQVWGAWSGEHSRIAALFGPNRVCL